MANIVLSEFLLLCVLFASLLGGITSHSPQEDLIEYEFDSEGRSRKVKMYPHTDHTGQWKWDPATRKWYLPTEIDFYTFNVTDIDGKLVSLEKYRGKAIMVVNVASECGWTESHYTELVELQKEFEPTGKFTVMGFPCNQFGGQEPGSNGDIKDFAIKKYKVNFPLFAKVDIKGEKAAPVFQYIVKNGKRIPDWNFWKWLVDAEGKVRGAYESRFTPSSLKHLVKHLVAEAKSLDNPEDPNNPHGFNHGEL